MKQTPTPVTPRSALHTRLEELAFCDESDFKALDDLLMTREEVDAGQWIVREGEDIELTHVVMSGWATRYKTFADGRRQILEFLLPGDIIGLYTVMLRRADFGIETLTPVTLSAYPAASLLALASRNPRLVFALGWLAGQGERRLDEHVTRVGRRGAAERMAHLFVELYVRLRRIGFERGECRRFPLTQVVLADALGMSHVHANRTFRSLARDELVDFENGCIVLKDIMRLAVRCRFDPGYLEQPAAPDDVHASLGESA